MPCVVNLKKEVISKLSSNRQNAARDGNERGRKRVKHTLRPREDAIAERHEADWDESFEIGSKDTQPWGLLQEVYSKRIFRLSYLMQHANMNGVTSVIIPK